MSDQAVQYDEYEVDDNGPRLIVRDMLTSSKAADLWLGDLQRRGYSRRTIDTYRRIVYMFCDRLPDDLDIAKVTGDDVRRFLDQLRKMNRGAAMERVRDLSWEAKA